MKKKELIPEKVDLITLLRTFKKEGLENFIVIRKAKFEKILKENENLLIRNKELEEENKNLKKYDIRNIKIEDDKILKNPSFTKKEIDLMNLGIALSSSFDKLFDNEREE